MKYCKEIKIKCKCECKCTCKLYSQTIVVLLPLTGSLSVSGNTYKNAIDLYIKNYPASGIKYIFVDTESDDIIFVKMVLMYIELGIRLFIGGTTSGTVQAWINFIDPLYGKIATLFSASSTTIFDKNYESIVRIVPNNQVTAECVYAWLLRNNKIINGGINIGLLAIDDVFGQNIITLFKKILPNITIATYNLTNIDAITNAAFSNGNIGIWLMATHDEYPTIIKIKAAYNSVLLIPIEHGYDNIMFNSIVQYIDPLYFSNIMAFSFIGDTFYALPALQQFVNLYHATYNLFPSVFSLGYASLAAFFNLFRGPYDRTSIVLGMEKFAGLNGTIGFLDTNVYDRDTGAYSSCIVHSFSNNNYLWYDTSHLTIGETIKTHLNTFIYTITTQGYIGNFILDFVQHLPSTITIKNKVAQFVTFSVNQLVSFGNFIPEFLHIDAGNQYSVDVVNSLVSKVIIQDNNNPTGGILVKPVLITNSDVHIIIDYSLVV